MSRASRRPELAFVTKISDSTMTAMWEVESNTRDGNIVRYYHPQYLAKDTPEQPFEEIVPLEEGEVIERDPEIGLAARIVERFNKAFASAFPPEDRQVQNRVRQRNEYHRMLREERIDLEIQLD